jgi:hypothetical protein
MTLARRVPPLILACREQPLPAEAGACAIGCQATSSTRCSSVAPGHDPAWATSARRVR